MASFTIPKWLQESWKEYKELVASTSPKFVRQIVSHKHFDKSMVFGFVMALVYIAIVFYFFL